MIRISKLHHLMLRPFCRYQTIAIHPGKKPVVEELPEEVTIEEWAQHHSKIHSQKLLFVNDEPNKSIPSKNGRFDSIRLAYSYHLDLVISPQIIWLIILQGLSQQIEANSENLRSKFVSFEGQKELAICWETFENSKQQYQDTFQEFNKLIAEEIHPS